MTKFEIDDNYFKQFEVHIVGANYHQELWILAEELETFNQHIIEKYRLYLHFLKIKMYLAIKIFILGSI